jgi:superfamily I DNA/RNA helicase
VAIVVGCTQGLIPFQKNDETPVEQAAILLEQRRLFYVAITRCTEILVLSSVIRMERTFAWKIGTQLVRGRGPIGRTIASQFIAELGSMVPPSRRGEEWIEAGYV